MQVARVLTYAYENHVQAFLEPTAELCMALLERDATDPARQDPLRPPGSTLPGVSAAALVTTTLPHIVFCGNGQTPLAFLGAECLRLLSQVRCPIAYPHRAATLPKLARAVMLYSLRGVAFQRSLVMSKSGCLVVIETGFSWLRRIVCASAGWPIAPQMGIACVCVCARERERVTVCCGSAKGAADSQSSFVRSAVFDLAVRPGVCEGW